LEKPALLLQCELSRSSTERDPAGLEPGAGVQQIPAGGRLHPGVRSRLQKKAGECQGTVTERCSVFLLLSVEVPHTSSVLLNHVPGTGTLSAFLYTDFHTVTTQHHTIPIIRMSI
jgi:hypothetical protein